MKVIWQAILDLNESDWASGSGYSMKVIGQAVLDVNESDWCK